MSHTHQAKGSYAQFNNLGVVTQLFYQWTGKDEDRNREYGQNCFGTNQGIPKGFSYTVLFPSTKIKAADGLETLADSNGYSHREETDSGYNAHGGNRYVPVIACCFVQHHTGNAVETLAKQTGKAGSQNIPERAKVPCNVFNGNACLCFMP